mmetsp:Transcript_33249/g.41108  ORF Transcript_33249/g.41108 Transcript_33249/m.41108 type:complete len:339 (-) Transcript_33249:2852-3868(-)
MLPLLLNFRAKNCFVCRVFYQERPLRFSGSLFCCPFYLSFSVYAVVRGLPALLLHPERLPAVARDHAARWHLARSVVAEHEVVRAKNARVALNLCFLNLDGLLRGPMHEVVLPRRVRPERVAIVLRVHGLVARGLAAAHNLHAAVDFGPVAASNWPFLASYEATTHAGARKNFARALLLRITSLTQATSALRLVLVHLSEGAHRASLLVLRVGAQETIEVLWGRPRASALVLATLNQALLIWQLASTARLLASSTTTLLRQKLVTFLEVMGADRLRIGEAFLLHTVVGVLAGRTVAILRMEHVLNVLRLVLGGIGMRLLLMSQLDGSCSIEKLRRPIS